MIEKENSRLLHKRNKFLWLWDKVSLPQTSITEVGARRQARLLAALSLLLLGMFFVGFWSTLGMNRGLTTGAFSLITIFIITLFVYILSRSKYFVWGAAVLGIMLILSAFLNIIRGSDNPAGSLYSFVIIGYILSSAFLPLWGLVSVVVGSLIGMLLLPQFITIQSMNDVVTAIGTIATIGFLQIILTASRNNVERERLAELLNANQELMALRTSLEQRIFDRTREITAAAEVGRILAQHRNLDILLPEAVNLVCDRFSLYYAQIYLLDPYGNNLFLRSGSGKVGQELLERGHRLPVNENSINGRSVSERQPVIVSDTSENIFFKPNPLLPLTRSEIAIPLQISGHLLGVLDLQSDLPNYFTEEKLPVFETLAGQLAVALENATLYQESQLAQKNLEKQSQLLTKQGWQELFNSKNRSAQTSYTYSRGTVSTSSDEKPALDNSHHVEIPISVSGEPIGAIQVEGNTSEPIDHTAKEVIETVSTQVASRLENLRLANQTQKALAETDALLSITAELNAAQEFEDVLMAITSRTILKDVDQSLMMCLFDRPMSQEQYPEWILPVAYKADLPVEIAPRYPLSAFEAIPGIIFTNHVVFLKDILTDSRLDRITRKLFQDIFHTNSSVIVPFVLANQSLGFVMGNFSKTLDFSEQETQRLQAIAGQVAITIQGLQLLKRTQERVRREQLLREVTEQINNATSTDVVLYRTAQELGRVLKQQVFIYLGKDEVS